MRIQPISPLLLALLLAGCSDNLGDSSTTGSHGGSGGKASGTSSSGGANGTGSGTSTAESTGSGSGGAASTTGAGGSGPCATRVTYGDAWIHPNNHPSSTDDADGSVTWDGSCTDDGQSSFATLSNGWKPYFNGHGACVIALDSTCPSAPSSCTTRVSYGAAWIPAQNHPNSYDDIDGRVFWDRDCVSSGGSSFGTLSNGWAPHFTGSNACQLSFAYQQCGGLYLNPTVAVDCPDPGVIWDGSKYVAACTSGGAANAYPLRTSTDLVSWTKSGDIFPAAAKPTWATGDFWAPEIHRVGNHFVAYFSARAKSGRLSIGAATGPTATGPFTDIGKPLVTDPTYGLIDVNEFEDGNGSPYLVWKLDGNAVGKATKIFAQPLSADGTALTGSSTLLLTNDAQSWEGGVIEGPWVFKKDGFYYLFYSGNSYANATYALGVARSSNPLGPYTRGPANPILSSNSSWVGPGHCSIIDTPAGDTYAVYHAWQAGHVNGPGDGRMILVDAVEWSGGWPTIPEAPSTSSRPLP